MLKRSLNRAWLVPAATMALMGCPDEELAPLEPCTVAGVTEEITQSGTDQVDLLFMVDDSISMKEEQVKLSEQLPRLVKILASGDLNQNGSNTDEGDFQPVKSLHLGVVSSNMGTQGQFAGACKDDGDDGKLLKTVGAGAAGDPNCQGLSLEAYQTYVAPENAGEVEAQAQAVADEFGCVAARGTNGCGLEQQLESMLKAVTPATSDITFVSGKGHGTVANKGFVRDDAVLAIIHVTDEEDCSATKKGRVLFDSNYEDPYNGPVAALKGINADINYQCAGATDSPDDDPTLLQPTERFITGLKALKPNNPDRIIFAAIAGIPLKAEGADFQVGEVQDFDKILAMDEMQVFPGQTDAGDFAVDKNLLPRPACRPEDDATAQASPARRFVEVAKGFGANGVIRSICSDDYSGALTKILEKISRQLTGACLPNPLNPDNKGVVRCDVVEILGPKGKQADCAASRGRTFKEVRTIEGATEGMTEQRVVCNVNQVAVINGKQQAAPSPLPGVNPLVGWFYDNYSEDVTKNCPEGKRQRISTTSGAGLAEGASFSFECFSPVGGSIDKTGLAAVGAACTGNDQCQDAEPYDLFCEDVTRTCQVNCSTDANCPDGWVCDAQGGDKTFCVNPKCPPSQN